MRASCRTPRPQPGKGSRSTGTVASSPSTPLCRTTSRPRPRVADQHHRVHLSCRGTPAATSPSPGSTCDLGRQPKQGRHRPHRGRRPDHQLGSRHMRSSTARTGTRRPPSGLTAPVDGHRHDQLDGADLPPWPGTVKFVCRVVLRANWQPYPLTVSPCPAGGGEFLQEASHGTRGMHAAGDQESGTDHCRIGWFARPRERPDRPRGRPRSTDVTCDSLILPSRPLGTGNKAGIPGLWAHPHLTLQAAWPRPPLVTRRGAFVNLNLSRSAHTLIRERPAPRGTLGGGRGREPPYVRGTSG